MTPLGVTMSSIDGPPPAAQMKARTEPVSSGDVVVQVDQLRIAFGHPMPILDNVSIDIHSGEFIAIVGKSGGGKTTLMNAIAGLVPPDSGQVLVNGKAPRAGGEDTCYILARDALLPWRTVRANVEFGLQLAKVPRDQRARIARGLLEEVGLGRVEGFYPAALSQGMRQRVSLARAFAVDRPLYLMDEPFSALDAETRLVLHEQLLKLWEGRKPVVVFVTHDIGESVVLADRVYVMRGGDLGTAIEVTLPRPRSAELLQGDPHYHELYRQVWTALKGEC